MERKNIESELEMLIDMAISIFSTIFYIDTDIDIEFRPFDISTILSDIYYLSRKDKFIFFFIVYAIKIN